MLSLSEVLKKILLSLHYRIIYGKGMDKIYRLYQELRIKRIRRKSKIKVLFILGEASTWKTESLFKQMLAHPRFQPILGVTESMHNPGSKPQLISYLQNQGYDFVDLDTDKHAISKLKPDIKFYYKPYELAYRRGIFFDYNLKSIVCSINYGFNVSGDSVAFKHPIRSYSWREFVENSAVVEAMKQQGKSTGNKAITGLPLQDVLSIPKEQYQDPWADKSGKKRIIYAPHHSFKGYNGSFIEYATFLEFGEFMLQMAKKSADQIHWVFKPHPTLKAKLSQIWGEERTQQYYQAWEDMPNSQVELGEYYSVFKYSDAMIHDCSSFIVEYLFTDNPVLFLENCHHTAEEMHLAEYGYNAYGVHQHASTEQQIEQFIQQVINGEDPNKKARNDYFSKYLSTPNNRTASENIIAEILGSNE